MTKTAEFIVANGCDEKYGSTFKSLEAAREFKKALESVNDDYETYYSIYKEVYINNKLINTEFVEN